MIKSIKYKVLSFFTTGNIRSQKLKKNVAGSFVIKGVSLLIGLVKVPILLSYLNPEKYGVWLTIVSIVLWVQYFDLGLGHGLRNKFAEALAKGEKNRAKGLVSTAYFSMSAIMLPLFIILIPIVYTLDWNNVLNVTSISDIELQNTVALTLLMFVLRFVFQLITIILKADQRSAISDVFMPIESSISLLVVICLKYTIPNSLFWASAAISVTPVLVLLLFNIYFFSKDYKSFSPNIKSCDKVYLKDIYSIGLKFFFIQMVSLVLYGSANFILAKVVNPKEVAVYNIARTYYEIPFIFFSLILVPFWSAITEAYVKDELEWIKYIMKKLRKVAVLFSLGLIIMLLISDFVFMLWVGSQVVIPIRLSIVFVLYNIILMFLAPYGNFLNGVSKLNLGMHLNVFKAIAFIPVAIFFVNTIGSAGLIIALIVINSLPNAIFNIRQYKKIINKTAIGIWNR